MNLAFNLFTLKRELEINKQREYTWREIAHATSVHHNTLYNIANNKTRRVDMDTMAALLTFFANEGMPITPADLFIVEPSTPPKDCTSD